MKGGVRLYITKQYMQWRVVWDFTSDDKEKWWRREVVTKGSGVFADRIGVAAWLLSSGVAMCVERLLRWCCETYCNGCMNVAWALFWGGSWWSTKPCFFPCKVAAAGDERYLECAAVAAAVVSCANRFLLCVLQRVVVPLCVVLCVSWISGCRWHWNGCMIVVMLCCHVRRYMRVSHVMLPNAL